VSSKQIKTVTPLLEVDTLKLVYFAYFHSVMSYGVIFWGNSTDSKRVFIIQKKIIIIMAGVKRRVSCRKLSNKFNMLPLASEFLLSLLSFVVDNTEKLQTISDIHNINTRHKHDLHQPSAKITGYQKGAYCAGIKLFSTLPDNIKSLNHDIKLFKPALKDYLSHSYCVEEFTSIRNY
jgi:hypothetical protein